MPFSWIFFPSFTYFPHLNSSRGFDSRTWKRYILRKGQFPRNIADSIWQHKRFHHCPESQTVRWILGCVWRGDPNKQCLYWSVISGVGWWLSLHIKMSPLCLADFFLGNWRPPRIFKSFLIPCSRHCFERINNSFRPNQLFYFETSFSPLDPIIWRPKQKTASGN